MADITFENVVRGIREITLDQFPQPAYLIQKKPSNSENVGLRVTDSKVSLVKESKIDSLSKLLIDGTTFPNFNPDRLEYEVFIDFKRPGKISYRKTLDDIEVVEAENVVNSLKSIVTLVTTSSDESNNRTYTITVNRRNDKQLLSLTVKRVSCPYFDSQPVTDADFTNASNIYVPEDFELPVSTSEVRVVLQDPSLQPTTSINTISGISLTTAVSGVQRIYTFEKNECPLIKELFINGEFVEGFFPYKTQYDVEIAADFSGDITASFLPFIDFDDRHTYEQSVSTVVQPHVFTISVKSKDTGNVIGYYNFNITYKDPTYPIELEDFETKSFPFSDAIDIIDLGTKMKSNNNNLFDLDFWPTLITSDPPTTLVETYLANLKDDEPAAIYRKSFFDDDHYRNLLERYFQYYYSRGFRLSESIEVNIMGLPEKMVDHMMLWVSFYAVEDRRAYEMAGQGLMGGADNLDLSTGFSSLIGGNNSLTSELEVQIGSVFTMREKPGGAGDSRDNKVGQVGADNVLGDDANFWYRLQGHIRKRFEDIYRDYALRSNQVLEGVEELDPATQMNYMAFFDSYPYQLSPYSRGIFGGGRSISDSSSSYSSGGII